jgi:hypothetical protein
MHKSLHLLAAICIATGACMTLLNDVQFYQASLSGQGSTMVEHAAAPAVMKAAAGMTVVQAYEKANASAQLVEGILLILLGFFLHGLLRMRDERPVHITVKPKRRRHSAYWMELRI